MKRQYGIVGRATAWRGEVTFRRDEDGCPPKLVGTVADPTTTPDQSFSFDLTGRFSGQRRRLYEQLHP